MIDGAIDTEIAEMLEPEAQEKMIPASKVTELVKTAKLRGRDTMQEELNQAQQEISRLSQAQQAPAIDEAALTEKIRARLMEDQENQRKADTQAQHQEYITNQSAKFFQKMENGKNLYPDFEKVTADFDLEAFPDLALLAADLDNTEGIMYELSKDPDKVERYASLARKSPMTAKNAMKQLAESVKAKQEAQATDSKSTTNAPLDKMQSSPVGSGGGKLGIADFKKMYKKR